MATFDELVESRKTWIADVLKPWCQSAPLAELKQAAEEWVDIAGRVSPEMTLWPWAWSRFPGLVQEELNAIDETSQVEVTLKSGEVLSGYPDTRESPVGKLVLFCVSGATVADASHSEPMSLDEIESVRQLT
ncbi:MAG: hypothetical protein CMJ78_19570 [Planctomycetaceae bacterium]|nr:hypothetical protein [Planctomycetaceae bacterium]